MNQDIENKIKQTINKVTKIPIGKINSDATLFEFGVSSLQFFECVVKIEDLFDISFSERDLVDIRTINDVVNKVLQKLNKKA